MGLACFKACNEAAQDELIVRNKVISNDQPSVVERQPVPLVLINSDDEEEVWWDAENEVIDLEEVIEEWQNVSHANLGPELTAEVELELHKHHGHLIPAAVEQAGTEHIKPRKQHAAPITKVHVVGAAVGLEGQPPQPRSDETQLHAILQNTAAVAALKAAKEAHAEGQILKARSLVQQAAKLAAIHINALIQIISSAFTRNANENFAILQQHGIDDIDLAAILTQAKEVEDTLDGLDNDDSWLVSRDKGGLRVLYGHIKGTTCHSIKLQAVFTHTPDHIVSVAHEWDLQPTWNRFCIEAIKLAEPTIFEAYVYACNWMPKPFRHVQVAVKAHAFDLAEEHRSLLILVEDIEQDESKENGFALPAVSLDGQVLGELNMDSFKKRNLANILKGSCIKLRPLARRRDGKDQTEAFLLVHIDPHIPYVPAFLLNFALGVLAPYVYNQMKHLLDSFFDDPNGPYMTRIQQQPEVYGRIKHRMAEYRNEFGWTDEDFEGGGSSGSSGRHITAGVDQ